MKHYAAIIFDLDGTLIDSLPCHFLSFKDILLERGIRVSDPFLRRIIGLSTLGILKELRKKYGFRENYEDLREERRYHYFKFLGRRNIVFPGVRAMLAKLRLEYKLAIATGSSKVVLTHSTDLDFQSAFDISVTINDVRRGKPHPEQLVRAARLLRADRGRCLMVGDSIYDGMAAKSAGMDFVGVLTGFVPRKDLLAHGALAVLKSARDLPGFLARAGE
jgi:HAD superfamily hydrolase (TIGR01509 family)